ncbi:MAG: hypothetical protein ACK6DV_15290, partial [Deltaproteobacteria bacterium]
MVKRSHRIERISEAPSEPPESAGARAVRNAMAGCAVTTVVTLLLAGLFGLGVFVTARFATGTETDVRDEPSVDEDGLPVPTHGPPRDPTLPDTALDPLAEMRRRYVAGPHVRVEGMIPSEQTYRAQGASSPWQSARSADTPWLVLGATYD